MKLKEYLEKRGLKQLWFAKQIHYSAAHLSNILTGLSNPSIHFMKLVEEKTEGLVTLADFGYENLNGEAANE